jgi:hypothetical protein
MIMIISSQLKLYQNKKDSRIHSASSWNNIHESLVLKYDISTNYKEAMVDLNAINDLRVMKSYIRLHLRLQNIVILDLIM